jgi:hypothetical protein
MVAAGLLLAGPIVFWIIAEHGLAAKVAANPSITDLDAVPMPVALKTVLGVIATFVGWGPLEVLVRWFGSGDATSSSVVAKESFWLITNWVTTLAGTMAGLLVPFLFALRALKEAPRFSQPLPWGLRQTVGVGIAVVLNSALAGFYSNQGMMQAALIPLGLGAYAVLAARLAATAESGSIPLRRVAWATAVIGTAPWLLMNVGTGVGVRFSPTVRARFLAGSEGDYIRLLSYHLEPLGMAAMPAVPCLAAVLLIALLVVHRRIALAMPNRPSAP